MISFNDLLEDGCQFESPIHITAVSFEGECTCVYEGEGEDIPRDKPWGDGYVSHIYYDYGYRCITIEIEQDE